MITAARRFALVTALTLGAVTASTVLAPAATTHARHVTARSMTARSLAARHMSVPASTPDPGDGVDDLMDTMSDQLAKTLDDMSDVLDNIDPGLGDDVSDGT